MAQRKSGEQVTLEQVLKLASQLTSEDQDELVEQLKLQWLRRALDEGEESIRQHGTLPAEEVFAQLEERNAKLRQHKQP
jgi:hypothetical protein